MNSWQDLLRPDLVGFAGYGAASPEHGLLRLHANESPCDPGGNATGLNRYPLPQPTRLINAMAAYYGVAAGAVLPTRGSDDAIDLLVRAFCRAGRDRVMLCPPTFGMYSIAARIQNAGVVEVPLRADEDFSLDVAAILQSSTAEVRLVFICTPNNPTGNLIPTDQLRQLATALAGRAMLVVDEAYMEFAQQPSAAALIAGLPNVVVLRTLSKAFGLAGLRCGALLAQPDLVAQLRSLLPPYPLSSPTITTALAELGEDGIDRMQQRVDAVCVERARVGEALQAHPLVRRVWPSTANFLLVEEAGTTGWLTRSCHDAGILVRAFPAAGGLPDCVRITIGLQADNDRLLQAIGSVSEARRA